ncbi:MAG: alpha/beta hydrolase [Endomicrobiia bacterium]|nr:alpha/beta hydrolase [Endomicrobiia bacterium]
MSKHEIRVPPHSLCVEAYLPSADEGKTPLVFVGGVFDGSWIFAKHAEYMASGGRRVYALNLRGQYKSRWSNVSRLTVADYLEDISSSIKHLGLGSYILGGYSMGAALSLKFAESAFLRSSGDNTFAAPPPASLVLYDPTYPREAAAAVGEKPPKRGPRTSGAMHFIPPKSVVEEMLDETILDGAYVKAVELFRYTYASSRVYNEIEIERLESNPAALKCPALILAVNGKNPAFEEFARRINASLFLFGGYSHGSFLTSRYFEPVARAVEEWLDGATGGGKIMGTNKSEPVAYNWHTDLSFEGGKHKMKLRYFTGWNRPSVEIYSANGEHASSVNMKTAATKSLMCA